MKSPIRPMIAIATCKTCPAFTPVTREKDDSGGVCRVVSPTPLFMGVGKDFAGRQQPIVGAHWAGVGPTDFCMQHPQNRHLMEPGEVAEAPRSSEPALPPLRTAGNAEPIPRAIKDIA
jgi:hypothetical protein